jgi:hypothetical protein
MRRKLTPKSSLDNLKREAKRWLKPLLGRGADPNIRDEGDNAKRGCSSSAGRTLTLENPHTRRSRSASRHGQSNRE